MGRPNLTQNLRQLMVVITAMLPARLPQRDRASVAWQYLKNRAQDETVAALKFTSPGLLQDDSITKHKELSKKKVEMDWLGS